VQRADQAPAGPGGRWPELGDEDRATGAQHAEHLLDGSGAERLGQVMEHQAADHDVVRAVRCVEGFGDAVGEGAVACPGQAPGVRDRLAGGIHAVGAATRPDGFGHPAGEVPTAAADVEGLVAGASPALGGQSSEEAAPAAPEEHRPEDVVASSVPDERAGRASVGSAVAKVCLPHHDLFHR